MTTMIEKLLIANRGEIACRMMRTCQQMGIATVAVYSDADANALHVEMADEAVHIGASPATESYLNIDSIVAAALQTGAQAVHPGYGFLAENAAFAQAVVDAGLVFVGPTPESIELMGNKRRAKEFLQGIPYVPGYTGEDQSDDVFLAAADESGYPVMLKAAAGGGGKGMRLVHSPEDMPDALAAARREAAQAFGDATLMLEKALIRPRHIEVQIVGDQHGNVLALGERECSIQRRHQKIIEETPAAGLDDDLRHAIHEAAVQAAQQLGYVSAGTVEFLLGDDGQFYFMEMNTRLQVEHPVTEMVYGIDLVRWQIEIAEGAHLDDFAAVQAGNVWQPDGHAIEVRVYAEDPANGFLPVTGDVLHWQAPPHVRTDSGIRSGDTISPYYDPMLAKIIAHGKNRQEAIRKLAYALRQLQFFGLRNNVAFLRRVLLHEDHLAGNISTQFLQDFPELMTEQEPLPRVALMAAALGQHSSKQSWRNNPNRPLRERFRHGDTEYEVHITPQQNGHFMIHLTDAPYSVLLHNHDEKHLVLSIDGHRQQVTLLHDNESFVWVHTPTATVCLEWLSPLPVPQQSASVQGSLRAPMPGQVIQVAVEEGQVVQAGDLLMILEAMKMEHRIEAPTAGTVDVLFFAEGDAVHADAILVSLHPIDYE